MENTANEFIKLVRERLKYPIATLYGIILIIYNWDVLSVFFLSKKNIEERVVYINENFADPDYKRLWAPLLKSIFYFLLAPLIMLILEFSIKTINKLRRRFKRDRELEELDHDIEKAKKEFDIAQEKNGTKTQQQITERIDEMQKLIDDSTDSHEKIVANYDNAILQREEQIKVLNEQMDNLQVDYGELKEKSTNYLGQISRYRQTVENNTQSYNESKFVVGQLIRNATNLQIKDVIKILSSLRDNGPTDLQMLYKVLNFKVSVSQFNIEIINKLIDLTILKNDQGVISLTTFGILMLNSLLIFSSDDDT